MISEKGKASIRKFGNQVWVDGIEFDKYLIQHATKYKEESLDDFIKISNFLWGYEMDKEEHRKELKVLHTYVNSTEIEE